MAVAWLKYVWYIVTFVVSAAFWSMTRVAAVAEVGADPGPVGPLQLRAVVLGAADHELAVGRVQGQALELRGAEARCC